jgi:glycosyltransferase involved in cell wall biosynthesis
MFRRAPQVTSNSQRGAAFAVERFGAPADRIEVIPNGLTIEELDRQSARGTDLRAELGLAPGTPLIGFVGKDSWQKNVRRFLQVAAALREVRPEVRFVAVGWRLGPEDRDRLGAPPEVALLGTRTDVYRLLTQFDALVMTSDTEGCPNVVIEGGILGCPVVAPDVGDVRDIFGAEAADRLVPEQAIAGYVERLARLLEKRPHDREQTARWQQRVRREYAVETMVERTERLFTSALERKTIS